MKVLFSNAPWHKLPQEGLAGWKGVKAGSRWPHTFPYDGGSLVNGYIPFPFFLATAGALAKRNGLETVVRDSIALGESYNDFYLYVAEYQPDVIVMETTTPSLRNDIEIVKHIRNLLKNVIIIFTGIHFDLEKESFLATQPDIDFVVYGEYELSVNNLLLALQSGESIENISNLVYRDGEKVVRTTFGKLADLKDLPWPVRDELPFDTYFDSVGGLEHPQLQVHTTRGCPFGCIFCVWPQVIYRGRGYRMREPKDVIDEIEENLAKHPYKSIYIDDDTFNVNAEHVLEIARLIKERGLDRVPWSIMGRADLMTEEILLKLKEAGMFSVKYGVESASQDVLDEIDKRIDLDHVKKMIKFSHDIGLKVHLTFTFGLPSDTIESIEETIQLACDLPNDFSQFSIATPFPGTKMYDIYEEKGWITTKDWDCYNGASTAVSRTDRFTSEQLEGFVRKAYRCWNESRKIPIADFKYALKKKILGLEPQDNKILVLQCAKFIWTRELIGILEEMGYVVHLLLSERFVNKFDDIVVKERMHIFNADDFKYQLLKDFALSLSQKYEFAGAIVPYSNSSGTGYEEVEQIAVLAAGRIIAAISTDRIILK